MQIQMHEFQMLADLIPLDFMGGFLYCPLFSIDAQINDIL